MADYAVGTSDRNRKTAAVALEIAADAHVLGRYLQRFVGLLAGMSHLLGALAVLCLCAAFLCQSPLLCLAGSAFCLFTFSLILGSQCLFLGFCLTGLRLGDAPCVFACYTFCLSFLSG